MHAHPQSPEEEKAMTCWSLSHKATVIHYFSTLDTSGVLVGSSRKSEMHQTQFPHTFAKCCKSSLVSRRRGLSATYIGWAGPSVSSAGTRQVEPLGWAGHLVVCRSHYDDYEWVTLLAGASELLHGRAVY